jgi:hypothetical protein
MISLLSITEDGRTIEVAMIGNEGMMGVPIVLRNRVAPYQMMVQLAGNALRIRENVLRVEFDRGGKLQDLLLRYTHSVLIQVAQASSSYPTASLRVKNGSTVLATVASVNVGSNGKVKVDNISFTGDLGDSSKVKQSMYTFSWEISFDGSSWTSIGTTGAHEVHWLYANPIGPEFRNADSAPTPSTTYSGLYDLALRHATAKTGDGLTNVDQIIEAVTKGVDADLPYNPGRLTPDRHKLF